MSPSSRVAQMADVRGLIGIDVGVLDDGLRRVGQRHVGRRLALDAGHRRAAKNAGAVEEKIDVARAGDFHARHAGDPRELGGDLLRDLPRRAAQPLGQLESHRRGHLAHANVRRPLRD